MKIFSAPPKKNENVIYIHHKADAPSPLKVCSFWLRDHCRCTNCYGETFQRKTNLADIPLDIQLTDSKTENNLLRVTCKNVFKMFRLIFISNNLVLFQFFALSILFKLVFDFL